MKIKAHDICTEKMSMMVSQSLILGLGPLLNQAQVAGEVFKICAELPYAAVQISSNTETDIAMPEPFLGQQHGLDIPRSQLIHVLPMLSAKHFESDNVFANYAVSRRYARLLFAHAQESIWQHVETSVEDEAIVPKNVLLFINYGRFVCQCGLAGLLIGFATALPTSTILPCVFIPRIRCFG